MKNWVISSIILLSVSFPFLTSADLGYLAEDFGSSAYNGIYCYYGVHRELPSYVNGNDMYLYRQSDTPGQYALSTFVGDEATFAYWAPAIDGVYGVWQGSPPAGTIVETICNEEPPSPPVATTTATYQDWIFVNSWIIFLLAFIAFGPVFNLLKPKEKRNV